MERRKFLIGTAGAAATAAVGSLAYTSATVNRDVDVTVTTDDSSDAALRLQSGEGTTINDDGQLEVNGISSGSSGSDKYVTPDGSFVFGDTSAPTTTNAFTLTNQVANDKQITVSISNLTPDTSETDVSLEFFKGAGSSQGTATSSSDLSFSLTSGSTAQAVLTLDTPVDDSTNMTADIQIDADPV